ncbi:MAG: EthD family reductase, partial [Chloroflexi bacterium]|nr:EthD family reductase [Chloroflexota bacterium]
MPRLIALYNAPAEPDAFDAHYRDVHVPILNRYPNLRDIRLSSPQGVAGQPPPWYLMAEIIFDTDEDLQ